jgi:hypothetical protein
MADAKFWLEHGQQFPYADDFVPSDAADKAALAILANLCDRRGIKQELRAVDNDVRHDLLRDVAEIIRAAGVAVDAKPSIDNCVSVDRGALQMALNVLRRAGKDEVADALAAGVAIPDGAQQ